jgi:uncharacterized protein
MAQTKPEIKKIVFRYLKNLQAIGVTVEKAYLFGSQMQAKAGTESDIDLAIISPLFEKMSLWDRAGYLGKAAWDIPYPIDALGYSPSQVRKVEDGTLLSHILKKGIEIIQ